MDPGHSTKILMLRNLITDYSAQDLVAGQAKNASESAGAFFVSEVSNNYWQGG